MAGALVGAADLIGVFAGATFAGAGALAGGALDGAAGALAGVLAGAAAGFEAGRAAAAGAGARDVSARAGAAVVAGRDEGPEVVGLDVAVFGGAPAGLGAGVADGRGADGGAIAARASFDLTVEALRKGRDLAALSRDCWIRVMPEVPETRTLTTGLSASAGLHNNTPIVPCSDPAFSTSASFPDDNALVMISASFASPAKMYNERIPFE